MLKDLVEFLIGVGRQETPKFVAVPGRPDVAVEVVGNGFGRLWEATKWSQVEVPSFLGLRQFLQALGNAQPAPTSIEATANDDGVVVVARWVPIPGAGVVETRSVRFGVSATPEFSEVLALQVAFGESPRVMSPAVLVDLLRRRLGPSAVTRDLIDPFRVVDFGRMVEAKTVSQRGAQSFGKSVEAKVQNVERLPEWVDVTIALSPQVPGVTATVRLTIDPRPEQEGFAVWADSRETARANEVLAEAVRDRAEAAFLEVAEGVAPDHPIRFATVILGWSTGGVATSPEAAKLRR